MARISLLLFIAVVLTIGSVSAHPPKKTKKNLCPPTLSQLQTFPSIQISKLVQKKLKSSPNTPQFNTLFAICKVFSDYLAVPKGKSVKTVFTSVHAKHALMTEAIFSAQAAVGVEGKLAANIRKSYNAMAGGFVELEEMVAEISAKYNFAANAEISKEDRCKIDKCVIKLKGCINVFVKAITKCSVEFAGKPVANPVKPGGLLDVYIQKGVQFGGNFVGSGGLGGGVIGGNAGAGVGSHAGGNAGAQGDVKVGGNAGAGIGGIFGGIAGGKFGGITGGKFGGIAGGKVGSRGKVGGQTGAGANAGAGTVGNVGAGIGGIAGGKVGGRASGTVRGRAGGKVGGHAGGNVGAQGEVTVGAKAGGKVGGNVGAQAGVGFGAKAGAKVGGEAKAGCPPTAGAKVGSNAGAKVRGQAGAPTEVKVEGNAGGQAGGIFGGSVGFGGGLQYDAAGKAHLGGGSAFRPLSRTTNKHLDD